MKKLMTILVAFLCVSILLVSCGNEDDKKKEKVITPESEAKKIVDECACGLMELQRKTKEDPTNEKLQKEAEELDEKCEKKVKSLEGKYGSYDEPKDSDVAKKFWEVVEEEMKKCI